MEQQRNAVSGGIALALVVLIGLQPAYADTSTSTSAVPTTLPACKRELRDAILGYEALLEEQDSQCISRIDRLHIQNSELREMLAVRTPTVAASLVPAPEPVTIEHDEIDWAIILGTGAAALAVGVAVGIAAGIYIDRGLAP